MGIEFDVNFDEVLIGPAVNFRTTINQNFDKIKGSLEYLQGKTTELDNKVTELDNKITNFSGGTNIVLSATRPTGQKAGDYWFRTL